jgi:hypothetical protein
VDPIKYAQAAISLKGFAGWIGDAYGTDRSISILIDRPKQVIEVWEFDSTIVVIFIGVAASAAIS